MSALADKVSASSSVGSSEIWRDLRSVNPKVKKAFSVAPVQSPVGLDGVRAHDYGDIR